MAWLKANTNLAWCGYYLAPAPSHGDTSWMGARAALASAGWGIAPVYLGQQIIGPGSHNPSAEQGLIDGNDAADLMDSEGFPTRSCIYLDLENGPPLTQIVSDYTAAWCDAVTARGYQQGVYCSHTFAADINALRPACRIWAYKVPTIAPHPFVGTNFPTSDPAGSGYADAYVWQLGDECQLTLPDSLNTALTVDLDVALTADPGAP